ncbi:hypothetical protein HPB47_023160 [Ixodes persulcatus]|uniref:Uncharacterized protein n=1 Tax=Ixodes persulcatus TaxID=34615 RepID=A0AC60Q7T0_IXOPE|nr:hypothetical protein HPB47_023160 [Ixodes persulcatus]
MAQKASTSDVLRSVALERTRSKWDTRDTEANEGASTAATRRPPPRSDRVFRDHWDAFETSDASFVGDYRLTKGVTRWLCDQLRGKLQRRREGPRVLTVDQQVLAALRFYAAGGFQGTVGSDESIGVHQCSPKHPERQRARARRQSCQSSHACCGAVGRASAKAEGGQRSGAPQAVIVGRGTSDLCGLAQLRSSGAHAAITGPRWAEDTPATR